MFAAIIAFFSLLIF